MKKLFFIATFIFVFGLAFPTFSFAQGMMGGTTISDDHTAQEEAEGKIVWEKLQAKEVSCADLSDENFGTLGEYFMGIMMGDSHAAMNAMMIQMHGEEGEEQIHVVMGKRLSGCDTSAAFPGGSGSWMPMMNMLAPYVRQSADRMGTTGMWSSPFGFNQMYNNSMMNFGFMPFGWFGWIFMVLWWLLIIAGIAALIKWLAGESRRGRDQEKPFDPAQGRSPLDTLKERYAKGEIDKREFEEKKKDLIS